VKELASGLVMRQRVAMRLPSLRAKHAFGALRLS
jgi:hypothetical protein